MTNYLNTFQIKFLNPMITRRPRLQRQKKIFKHDKNFPRANQMNINVATWGRLIKRSSPSGLQQNRSITPSSPRGDTHVSITSSII